MVKGEEFTFVIKEHLAILATHTTGWKREVNIVEWNGNKGKVDIRDWNPSHENMSKGITLHIAEAGKLYVALGKYFEKIREEKKKEAPKEESEKDNL